MADRSELIVITEDIDSLKDKKSLSSSDVNRLMLIAGRLTGILRVCSSDPHVRSFTSKVDDIVASDDSVGKLFYFIPVAIELLDKQYTGNAKPLRRRYRTHKKKHLHKESEEDTRTVRFADVPESEGSESEEKDEEKKEEIEVCVEPPVE